MRRSPIVVLIVAMAVSGCGGVRHPLDDSETRPESAAAAQAEAASTLDILGATTMRSTTFTASEWVPDDGCDPYPLAPEQGDVGGVLIRSYPEPPGTIDILLDEQEERWRADGRSVDRGSQNMAPQVITRINGIGYSLVSTPPDAELRAFLPCY